MAVTLTDEQYGSIARALVYISAGTRYVEGGGQKAISRATMMLRAREACATIHLDYLGNGTGRSSFPDEIGLEYRGAGQ